MVLTLPKLENPVSDRSVIVLRIASGRRLSDTVWAGPSIESGSSSVVERQLPKLNVAGSIPVSRSNKGTTCQVVDQSVWSSFGPLFDSARKLSRPLPNR